MELPHTPLWHNARKTKAPILYDEFRDRRPLHKANCQQKIIENPLYQENGPLVTRQIKKKKKTPVFLNMCF